MIRYVVKRVLLMIPIILAVTFLIFFILDLMPGTPAQTILGQEATAEAVEELNRELGYDKPFIYRYAKYVFDIIVHQDMGNSYSWKRPVWNEVINRLPTSIIVAANGMLVAIIIGIPIGVLSAVKQYSALDKISTFISLLLGAIPAFWLSMVLIVVFSIKLGWLPTSGLGSLKHYILPAFGLGLGYAAKEMRYTRSSMLDSVRQDYIDTARSKGVPERRVIWKHALQNAMLPVVTMTGTTFSSLIGGALVSEQVFALSGVGSLMTTAIYSKDIPIVMGCVVVLATLYSVILLLIDILHAMIDPRIKARYANKR
jgi:peptide/nickel transport system permease protein